MSKIKKQKMLVALENAHGENFGGLKLVIKNKKAIFYIKTYIILNDNDHNHYLSVI